MPKQVRQIIFSGQHIYCGIDVHLRSFQVTILSQSLFIKTFHMEADAEQLIQFLKRNYPGAQLIVAYEAGFSGFWLQEKLQEAGITCLVVNPADIPTSDKDRKNKNDKRDSKKIAYALRGGLLNPIHIPSKETQYARSLLRTRQEMVKDLSRSKNRIKGFLNFYGIELPEQFSNGGSHWSKRFLLWLESLELDRSYGKESLSLKIAQVRKTRALLLQAQRSVRVLRRDPVYNLLAGLLVSVPGVGLITAMTLITELEGMKRFKRLDELCAFVGLVPNTSSSGEREKVGEITRRGNNVLRKALVESSWVAIRTDPTLLLSYEKFKAKMPANKAIVKVARKLLSRIRYVWDNQQAYKMGYS